jgi:hypothetical protein
MRELCTSAPALAALVVWVLVKLRRDWRVIVISMRTLDTTPRAAAIQLQRYREVGPAVRAQIAADLSEAARQTTMAGIRRRHPEYSEAEVARSFLWIVYGFGTER